MLTRLLPEQVSAFWDIIKFGIEESVPPIVGESPDRLNRILSSILSDKTQCWASYRREGEDLIFEGICLTKIIFDDTSDTKNLLIYSVYGYNKGVEESWMEAFLSVAKYAVAQKCTQIVTYTTVPYLIEKAKKYGANTDYTFIVFNIPQTSKKIINKEIR